MELVVDHFAVIEVDVFDFLVVGGVEVEAVRRGVQVVLLTSIKFLDVVITFWQLDRAKFSLAVFDRRGGNE